MNKNELHWPLDQSSAIIYRNSNARSIVNLELDRIKMCYWWKIKSAKLVTLANPCCY